MQDVYTFAGTDQCQLPEYGTYSYIYGTKKKRYMYIQCKITLKGSNNLHILFYA